MPENTWFGNVLVSLSKGLSHILPTVKIDANGVIFNEFLKRATVCIIPTRLGILCYNVYKSIFKPLSGKNKKI